MSRLSRRVVTGAAGAAALVHVSGPCVGSALAHPRASPTCVISGSKPGNDGRYCASSDPGDTDRERRTIFLNGLDIGRGCAFAAFAARASFAGCAKAPRCCRPNRPGTNTVTAMPQFTRNCSWLWNNHLASVRRRANTRRTKLPGRTAIRSHGRQPLGSLLRSESVGAVMSSYAKYCLEQAARCTRRARLASSPEVIAHFLRMEQRWLKIAEKADAKGEGLGFSKKALTPPMSMRAHA
jgi:hypothetical protein